MRFVAEDDLRQVHLEDAVIAAGGQITVPRSLVHEAPLDREAEVEQRAVAREDRRDPPYRMQAVVFSRDLRDGDDRSGDGRGDRALDEQPRLSAGGTAVEEDQGDVMTASDEAKPM